MRVLRPFPQTCPTRAVQVCDSRRLICPRCGYRLHRVRPHNGTAFAICEQRPPYDGKRGEDRCGQRVFVLAAPQGVSIVIGITTAEMERISEDLRPAHAIFGELGGIFPESRMPRDRKGDPSFKRGTPVPAEVQQLDDRERGTQFDRLDQSSPLK